MGEADELARIRATLERIERAQKTHIGYEVARMDLRDARTKVSKLIALWLSVITACAWVASIIF